MGPYHGYDIEAVRTEWEKVAEILKGPDEATRSMVDFDERDLVRMTESVGFQEIVLQLELKIIPKKPEEWSVFLDTADNPNVPTMREALDHALSREERERFERHLRPLVEEGRATTRQAGALLCAVKPGA